jgi:hypothetical protein
MTNTQTNQKKLNSFEKIVLGFRWTRHCFKIWKISMTTSNIFTNDFIFDSLSLIYWMELK